VLILLEYPESKAGWLYLSAMLRIPLPLPHFESMIVISFMDLLT